MNDEFKKAFGELAIVVTSISFAVARTVIAAYACSLAAHAIGYELTTSQALIALVALAVVTIKTPQKEKVKADETLRMEFVKLMSASIATFVIWCVV